jgi:hypothetical protein
MKRKTIVQENITPPLDELGEIRGMSISKTTTAKSCKKPKKRKQLIFESRFFFKLKMYVIIEGAKASEEKKKKGFLHILIKKQRYMEAEYQYYESLDFSFIFSS